MGVRENKTLLTAEDKATAVFKQFQRSLSDSSSEVDKLRNAAIGLGSVLTLGVGVAAVANGVAGLAKFRAELERVSVVTGTTVENLSVIGQAAKLTNTDMGTVQAALVKLTKGLSASNAETKDTARALEYLGVKGRDAAGNLRDPGVVMQEVAKMMGTLADGSNKTAIAMALFGKSGAEMLPVLKEMHENGGLVAKVTTEQAIQAKMYEQALVRLSAAQSAASKLIYGELIPPMTALVQVFTQAVSGSDSLTSSLKAMSQAGELTTWAEKLGGVLADAVDMVRITKDAIMALGASILSVGADIAYAAALASGNLGLMHVAYEARDSMAAEANKRWATLLEQNTNKTYDAYREQLKMNKLLAAAQAGMFDDQASRAAARESAAKGNFRGTDVDKPDKANPLQSLKDTNAELTRQLDLGRQLTEGEKSLEKIRSGAYDRYGPQVKAAAEALAKSNIALDNKLQLRKIDLEFIKQEVEAEQQLTEAWKKQKDSADALIGSMVTRNKELAFELTLVGKTTEQVELLRIAEDTRKNALKAVTAEQRVLIEQQGAATLSLVSQRQELVKQVGIWDSLATSAGNFFGDLVMNGKSAFDNLKSSLRSFVQEIIALFAKRYILQMVAGVTGSAGIGNAAASAGVNSLAGSALSAGASWLGSSALGTGFAMGSQTGVGVWAGAGYGEAAMTGVGAIGEAAGAMTSTLTSALAAIPVWGWIAIAALAAYAAFGGKGGGPKSGGSFQGIFDSTGTQTGTNSANLFGLKPEESTGNSAVQTIASAAAASYYSLVKQLGGNSQALNFGLGYDTDPRGTAQNRITGTVTDASGNTVFRQADREIGRDDKTIGPELQLTASRALIAALQASNLQADIAKLFSGVNASTATQDQIDALLKSAVDIAGALKAVASSNIHGLTLDVLKGYQAQGEALMDTFQRVATGWAGIANVWTTDAMRLDATQASISALFDTINVKMPATVDEWRALAGTIDMSTAAGRSLFDVMAQAGPAFQQMQNAIQALFDKNQSLLDRVYGAVGVQAAQAAFDNAANNWNRAGGWSTTAAETFGAFSRGENRDGINQLTNPFLADGVTANPQYNAALAALIGPLLSAFDTLRGAMAAQTNATNTNTGGISTNTQAVDALANARGSLADYLKGSLLSGLSPLDAEQRFYEAKRQYDDNYARAAGGNVDAIAAFGNTREAMLQALMDWKHSGGEFNAAFFGSYDQGAALSAGAVRPYSSADGETNTQILAARLDQVAVKVGALADQTMAVNENTAELVKLISDGIRTDDPRMLAVLERIAAQGQSKALLNTGGGMN